MCQKNNNNNNKKEIYNDKYKHTRDRLFGLHLDLLVISMKKELPQVS